jgi:general secretion pathway protein D
MRHRLAVIPIVIAALAFAWSALAQSLIAVQVVAEGSNQSIFLIDFGDKTPTFTTSGADAMHPTVSFANTSRSQGAVAPQNLRGLVRNVEFEQAGGALTLRFTTAVPAKATAQISPNRKLLVTVSRGAGADAAPTTTANNDEGDGPAPGAPLPQAYTPLPGEDGYELVMLKYADVSEVVGLLTEGITVKANNVFIRREPGFGSPGSTNTTYTNTQTQATQDDRPLGQSVDSSLAIDRRLNAMWIKGSPLRG